MDYAFSVEVDGTRLEYHGDHYRDRALADIRYRTGQAIMATLGNDQRAHVVQYSERTLHSPWQHSSTVTGLLSIKPQETVRWESSVSSPLPVMPTLAWWWTVKRAKLRQLFRHDIQRLSKAYWFCRKWYLRVQFEVQQHRGQW